MQTPLKPATVFLLLLFFCLNARAQGSYISRGKGYLSFMFGPTTFTPHKYQKYTLLGCNKSITDSLLTKKTGKRAWDNTAQVVSNIPCGWQVNKTTKDSFYLSKYYLASPPIMKILNNDTIYDIGIVTPDEFDLIGDMPVQQVYMDYNVLKRVYIEYIDIEFDSSFSNFDSSVVPFQVEAKGFSWRNEKEFPGAKGASGIGYLTNIKSSKVRLFLPYYYENNKKIYLDFQVTILNNILYKHEVLFNIDSVSYTSINLKDYKDKTKNITFTRKPVTGVPCGCKEPERAKLGPIKYSAKNTSQSSPTTKEK